MGALLRVFGERNRPPREAGASDAAKAERSALHFYLNGEPVVDNAVQPEVRASKQRRRAAQQRVRGTSSCLPVASCAHGGRLARTCDEFRRAARARARARACACACACVRACMRMCMLFVHLHAR